MEKRNKISTIIISLIMLVCTSLFSLTAVYAWFNGQGYMGKTMSYSRRLYIGSTSSEVTNYYGYMDSSENFIYSEINPVVGFEYNNLVPSSYIYLRSDIENTSTEDQLIVSLYLQNIVYDSPLNSFLYFGTNSPLAFKETYKSVAIYDEVTDKYEIESLALLSHYTIEPSETLSLYWFVHIDADAGMEVANANISLGQLVLAYNS